MVSVFSACLQFSTPACPIAFQSSGWGTNKKGLFDYASCSLQARVEPPGSRAWEPWDRDEAERREQERARLAESLQLHRAWEAAGKSHKKKQGTAWRYPAEEHHVGRRADWWRDHLQGMGRSHFNPVLLVLSFLDLQTFPIISWCRLVVQESSLLQTTVFCHRHKQVGTAADLQLFNPP